MYVFVVVDDDGTEGIPAIEGPRGEPLPLVAADMKRVESLRPVVARMARMLGKPITLCRFEIRTEIETFEPDEP